MSESIVKLFENEGGEFISPPSFFIDKLKKIKAVLFDWDGVFNDGFKSGSEGSAFSEVDSMATNMLRYGLWRINGTIPVTAVMTGENNPTANHLAKRESFNAVFSKIKNKSAVFDIFCNNYQVRPEEVIFFFDDILDLDVARKCGVRILIGNSSNLMLKEFVKKSSLADYITANNGRNHGLRESIELSLALLGQFDNVVSERMIFSENYQQYIAERKTIETIYTEG
ncbi:hypothetical protein BH09BAC3_BH09BAC3_36660 [soil metagenome]